MAKGISLLGSGQNKASSGGVPSENMFIPRACDGKSLADLPLNRVHPDPQQPRTWAEDELDELQAKIEGAGKILQPITVIPRADMPGHYLIKTGEGRWRVAGRLGWEFIPFGDRGYTSQQRYSPVCLLIKYSRTLVALV